LRSLLRALCVFGVVCAAFGQTDRGNITGTISDPAGAVVANAAVEARNVATGAVYPAATSATGNYTVAQLPAGTYELSVTVPGFKKYVRENLTVEVAGNVRIDAVLEVGSAAESITVEAAAPLLKTEGGEVATNIATQTLDDLPILTLTGSAAAIGSGNSLGNIRNPLSAVTLLPGARITTDTIMRINGMPSNSQSINIEGQDSTNGFFKQQNQVNQAGVEAIQEVAIQTSNFSAEYGQAGGGYFNYTMKSGTNQLHGSGYDYFVNEALDAGLPFTDAGSTNSLKDGQHIRNALRQNDYGFTLGGPIDIPKVYNGHDKTFFFFSFEQFRQSAVTTNTFGIVPTVAQRNGDFSAALRPTCNGPDPAGQMVCLNEIFDPTTTRTVGGSVVRTPFANNQIPLTSMDPTAKIIQNMIPLPNTPGLLNYTAPAYSNFRHTTIPSIKIDQSISAKTKISGYYSATETNSPQNNGFTEPYTALQPQAALSQTTRINLDTTISPTLLFHVGIGYLETSNPQGAPNYDQHQLFPDGIPFTANNYFPYLAGMFSANGGGWTGGVGFPGPGNTGVAFTLTPIAHDYKPTANTNLTWVKGNHTYKLGATALFEGVQSLNESRADGQFGFSALQTSDPWQGTQAFANFASSGFGYASFLLGQTSSASSAAPADVRLGMHSYGIYVQDSWKVTRKLTLDYGLRWDYATLWKEQYGRMQNAAFDQPNSLIGGRLGTVEYQATCHCNYSNAYPFAIGPHIGVAYQITPKTVFRGGGAISYAATSDQAGLNSSAGDFYTIGTPGYGLTAPILKYGDPLGPGNQYGNPVVHWPNFNPSFPVASSTNPLIIPPASPFVSIAPNSGRLPRTFQWSLGFQRELTSNLVVEAAYVGNRGAWWAAPLLASLNYNALTPQELSADGINIASKTDAALLLQPINSPGVLSRFPWLGNPNNVYPGFPATSQLIQALRQFPQWIGIPPFLGPPMGDTWYDSLQVKATKRFSHGLSAQLAYTWQKELTNGTNSNTSYVTPSPPLINDVYNPALDKQISGFSIPQELVIAFNYTTPKLTLNGTGGKFLSTLLRDWTYSGVLRYQSGQILQSPDSTNNLLLQMGRGPTNNPALWGGGYTFLNRVPGQPLFLVNPNGNFDPTKTLALNPAAWTEPPQGSFGESAAYFNDFRWQRQPAESMAFGRIFRIKERAQFMIRAEFQNIFNRLFYSVPADGSPFGGAFTSVTTATVRGNTLSGSSGLLSSGYGYVNWVNGGIGNAGGGGAQPRSGQIVARFTF
jgi:hypothetical protein